MKLIIGGHLTLGEIVKILASHIQRSSDENPTLTLTLSSGKTQIVELVEFPETSDQEYKQKFSQVFDNISALLHFHTLGHSNIPNKRNVITVPLKEECEADSYQKILQAYSLAAKFYIAAAHSSERQSLINLEKKIAESSKPLKDNIGLEVKRIETDNPLSLIQVFTQAIEKHIHIKEALEQVTASMATLNALFNNVGFSQAATASAKNKTSNNRLRETLLTYKLTEVTHQNILKALRKAAFSKNSTDVEFLIKEVGEDINQQDENMQSQKTALHWATIQQSLPCVQLLLQANAKFNIPDAFNKTAEHYAIASNNKELIKLFEDSKNDITNRGTKKMKMAGS